MENIKKIFGWALKTLCLGVINSLQITRTFLLENGSKLQTVYIIFAESFSWENAENIVEGTFWCLKNFVFQNFLANQRELPRS